MFPKLYNEVSGMNKQLLPEGLAKLSLFPVSTSGGCGRVLSIGSLVGNIHIYLYFAKSLVKSGDTPPLCMLLLFLLLELVDLIISKQFNLNRSDS